MNDILLVILIILSLIHIAGWLAISGILYLFAQYGITLGEFILIFFLWEIGIINIILEAFDAKLR